MRLKPPARKLLQILSARYRLLTRKHVPAKVLRHLWRHLVLKIPRIDRSITRPHMPWNDEIVMNPRNPIVAHSIPHHGRNLRTKRTLQILKLDNRHLCPSRWLEHRSVLERRSTTRRHRSLRTSRNTRNKSQSQNETLHHETHSSSHLNKPGAPSPALSLPKGPASETWVLTSVISLPHAGVGAPFMARSHRDMSGPSREARSVPTQNAIHLPIHNSTLDAHDKLNPDRNQSGESRTAPFNAPLAPTEVRT
jgi:hypothetical protein